MMDKIRLQVYMARAGIASRRKCEEYIQEGRVRVNGTVVTRKGIKVSDDDTVLFNNKPVNPIQQYEYIALHKPPGFVSTNEDPQRRPKAVDLLRPAVSQRVFSIGRLDMKSSGLLIFTNDGPFANKIMHPSSKIEKEYQIVSRKTIPDSILDQLVKGVEIEGIRYTITSYKRKTERTVSLILHEGKNRELRNAFSHFNIPLKRIHRVRIGIITLKGLASGHFRRLTEHERNYLLQKKDGKKQ